MAQQTQLTVTGTPGQVQSFLPKTLAIVGTKGLTLETRSVALRLGARSPALVLDTRSTSLTLEEL